MHKNGKIYTEANNFEECENYVNNVFLLLKVDFCSPTILR